MDQLVGLIPIRSRLLDNPANRQPDMAFIKEVVAVRASAVSSAMTITPTDGFVKMALPILQQSQRLRPLRRMTRVWAQLFRIRKSLFNQLRPENKRLQQVRIGWQHQADFEGPVF